MPKKGFAPERFDPSRGLIEPKIWIYAGDTNNGEKKLYHIDEKTNLYYIDEKTNLRRW